VAVKRWLVLPVAVLAAILGGAVYVFGDSPLSTTLILAHFGSADKLFSAFSSASDSRLPSVVAWVNGVPIERRAVAQAEVIVLQQSKQPPATQAELEKDALDLVIEQVVADQVAQQQGLEPSTSEALSAYQQLVHNPADSQIVGMSGGPSAPSQEWIDAYRAAIGRYRLEQQVAEGVPTNQKAEAISSYLKSLVNNAKVVFAPGVP
jgi:hypothetical protein